MSANFLDTNILIYLFDEEDKRKSDLTQQQVSAALRTGESIISFQVVQETLNVLTKKLLVPASPEQAARFLTGTLIPL